MRDSSDITYSTSFDSVWELLLDEFPGANVCFDDLDEFLAEVTEVRSFFLLILIIPVTNGLGLTCCLLGTPQYIHT